MSRDQSVNARFDSGMGGVSPATISLVPARTTVTGLLTSRTRPTDLSSGSDYKAQSSVASPIGYTEHTKHLGSNALTEAQAKAMLVTGQGQSRTGDPEPMGGIAEAAEHPCSSTAFVKSRLAAPR